MFLVLPKRSYNILIVAQCNWQAGARWIGVFKRAPIGLSLFLPERVEREPSRQNQILAEAQSQLLCTAGDKQGFNL